MDTSNLLDRPSLVILIDCWAISLSDKQSELMQNIQTFCKTNSFVKAVGLASHVNTEQTVFTKEEPWYSQGKDFFYSSHKWESLREVWQKVDFKDSTRYQTHPIVRDMKLRSDQRQFLLWSDLQVMYYCNHINPSIENIFVIGQAWDQCLEFRSTGWKSLSNLNQSSMFRKKKTILSRKDCVLKTHSRPLETIEDPWVELTDNIVMLDETRWKKMLLDN